MDKLFLSVLNMSLTGAFVIAAICLARLPLKKAPKIISYCLWAVACFRLVFPFSIESIFSLIPFNAQPLSIDIAMQTVPQIDSGIPYINYAANRVLSFVTPIPEASVNPLQVWTVIGAYAWLIGIAVMLIYSVVSIVFLKRRLGGATYMSDNIYEAANLKTPLVIGLFRPKIYIPAGLSGDELRYILLHEKTHIRRGDHLIKMLAYFTLCLHWFNPLVWVAFLLMGADMEMSCDERVLKELGGDIRSDYSMSLVRIATGRRILNGSPLAFGENGMKERIKRVLNFRKPSMVIVTLAVTLVLMLSVGFAVNRVSESFPWTGLAKNNDWPVRDMCFDRITFGTDREYIISRLGEPHAENPYYDSSVLTYYFPPHLSRTQGETNYVEVPGTDIFLQIYLDDPDCIAKGVSGVWRIDVTGKSEMTGRSDVADGTLAGVLAQYGGPDSVERNGNVYKLWYHSPEDFFKRLWFEVENGELTMRMGIIYIIGETYNHEYMSSDSYDFNALSVMRTPYVGNNSAVGKIVSALPTIDINCKQQFFSIGDDYGTGYDPYTLTIYYECINKQADFEFENKFTNVVLLFALIDNLDEVNFAIRETSSNNTLNKEAYTFRITNNRSEISDAIDTWGLTWEDFHNDWNASIEKAFSNKLIFNEDDNDTDLSGGFTNFTIDTPFGDTALIIVPDNYVEYYIEAANAVGLTNKSILEESAVIDARHFPIITMDILTVLSESYDDLSMNLSGGEQLRTLLMENNIVSFPQFQIVPHYDEEYRFIVNATVLFDNNDSPYTIAVDYRMDMGYPTHDIYIVSE